MGCNSSIAWKGHRANFLSFLFVFHTKSLQKTAARTRFLTSATVKFRYGSTASKRFPIAPRSPDELPEGPRSPRVSCREAPKSPREAPEEGPRWPDRLSASPLPKCADRDLDEKLHVESIWDAILLLLGRGTERASKSTREVNL